MKRLIALLLAVFLLLCGCAAGNEPKALKEQGEGKRTESIAVVKITINPEFELYLDLDLCVSKVRCLNEDAVTALAATEATVIGMPYHEAMTLLLDGVDQAGFLTQGAVVKLETTIHTPLDEESLPNFISTIASPVEQFGAEHDLDLFVNFPAPVIDEKTAEAFNEYYEMQIALQPETGNETTHPIPDENDNEIDDPTIDVTAEPGSIVTTVIYDGGIEITHTTYYDENSFPYKIEEVFSNGTTRVSQYYETGELESLVTSDASGHFEWHYDQSGVPSAYYETDAEGNRTETTFYSNGTEKTYSVQYASGATREVQFYENGLPKHTIENGENGQSEYFYDENGMPTESYTTEVDGTYHEQFYYPNGHWSSAYSVYPDGTVVTSTAYENGEKKSSISEGPEQYDEHHYTEDGICTYYLHITDTHRSESAWDENGNHTYWSDTYWDEDGNLRHSIEFAWDENGNLLYSNEEFYD